MCASATNASLKFPLQDPLQQVASINTATISSKLICFDNKQISSSNTSFVGILFPNDGILFPNPPQTSHG